MSLGAKLVGFMDVNSGLVITAECGNRSPWREIFCADQNVL